MRGNTRNPNRPTIRQVADTAGVSIGTVSRVLNAHDSVRSETRARVKDAIRTLGYEPDSIAQSLRNRTTRTVGCIIRDITIPTLASFVKAAQDELYSANYALVVANSEGHGDRELELLSLFARRRADGLILSLSSEENPALLQAINLFSLPVVLLDREIPKTVDSVTIDHATGMQHAVEYLLNLGHRRIALITGKTDLRPARQRVEGYRRAHQAWDIPVKTELLRSGSFLAEYGFRETSALLSSSNRPTAVISGGMDMLSGILRAVRTYGLDIPEDISVIACSDCELAQFVTPPISAIYWDWTMVGRFTARTLLDRLQGAVSSEARTLRLSTELVIRSSCGAPGVAQTTDGAAAEAKMS